jgi:hypothetical protein
MSSANSANGLNAEVYDDPYRHTCLIPYVDAKTAPPAIADRINVLPFRRNIFLLLGHSQGLFPHLMGVVGGCFNGQVRKIPLLDWVSATIRASFVVCRIRLLTSAAATHCAPHCNNLGCQV